MKEELSIDIIGLAGACSYALDCIEAELVNIKNKHGKRVAYISIRMAEYWKIQGDELQDLAMCALLHLFAFFMIPSVDLILVFIDSIGFLSYCSENCSLSTLNLVSTSIIAHL